MQTFCKAFEHSLRFSSSQSKGFLALLNGTLNKPFELTRYKPLKQVLFKKINRAAFSSFSFLFPLIANELYLSRFSKKSLFFFFRCRMAVYLLKLRKQCNDIFASSFNLDIGIY